MQAPSTKSVHRRFVHSTFQTRGDYTPTRATQCANVVWSDLGRLPMYDSIKTLPRHGQILLQDLLHSLHGMRQDWVSLLPE